MQRLTRRAVQGGASVASGDGGDGREHVVLDERTRKGDADLGADAGLDDGDELVHNLLSGLGLGQGVKGDGRLVLGNLAKRISNLVAEILHLVPCACRTTKQDVDVLTSHRIDAGSTQSLLKLNVNQLVRLLVVDHNIHVRGGKRLLVVKDVGRGHAVELANLRRALQHLNRVLVCEHTKLNLNVIRYV